MAHETIAQEVWRLTKPPNQSLATKYRRALASVLPLPPGQRYLTPFERPKRRGGTRTIWPAGKELKLVQQVLAWWLVKNFPHGNDFCYFGGGVLAAVLPHQSATHALVMDLENAFESVRGQAIVAQLRVHLPLTVETSVLEAIADLLTLDGLARQGCVSSPYAYNLVMAPLDKELADLCRQERIEAYTRYADNFCFSSAHSLNLRVLARKVTALIERYGFRVNWASHFAHQPIIYLGTKIWHGNLSLADEKATEMKQRLEEDLTEDNPRHHLWQVIGFFGWAKHICGEEIPTDLVDLFAQYFAKVGQTPATVAQYLAQRQTSRMA